MAALVHACVLMCVCEWKMKHRADFAFATAVKRRKKKTEQNKTTPKRKGISGLPYCLLTNFYKYNHYTRGTQLGTVGLPESEGTTPPPHAVCALLLSAACRAALKEQGAKTNLIKGTAAR